jgi:hypothetical protein
MLQAVEGYYLSASTSGPGMFIHQYTHGPLPPGTNVYATISLSSYNNQYRPRHPDPTGAAIAFIDSWTVYQENGTQSAPIRGNDFT